MEGDVCESEKEQQRKFSPCKIEDDEHVLRSLHRPDMFKDGNRLSHAAFTVQDMIEPAGDGISVSRKKYLTKKILNDTKTYWENKSSANNLNFYAQAHVGSLREITADNDERVFCVIDDGVIADDKEIPFDNAAHGLVTPSKNFRKYAERQNRKAHNEAKKSLRPLRDQLIREFSTLVSFSEIYDKAKN